MREELRRRKHEASPGIQCEERENTNKNKERSATMKPRRGAVQYRQGVDDNDCCSHCLVLQAINTLKSRGHERKCRRKICHASFASKAEKRVTAASVFCRNALAAGMTGALSFCESSQSHRTRHKVSASSQRATTEAYTRVKTLLLRRLAYSNDGGARLPRLAHLLECDTVYIYTHSVSHLLLHDPNATCHCLHVALPRRVGRFPNALFF